MRRSATVALGAALALTATAIAQVEPSTPMRRVDGGPCTPPFADACPPAREGPSCDVRQRARSRDRSVSAELVADGSPLGLSAIHLVVRRGADAWAVREIAHEGVGCGTFELYSTSFAVRELRVADVLAGPAPEVVLRFHTDASGAPPNAHDHMLLCTTDTSPPRCVARAVTRDRLRFQRPSTVISGPHRYEVDLGPQ